MFALLHHNLRHLLACACLLGSLCATAPAVAALEVGEQVVLSGRSIDNRRPAVASSADGRHTFVVWEGLVAGDRRILLREAVDGIWLPEVLVDNSPLSENQLPAVEVDAVGNPHVAWVARVRGKFVPQFALRVAGNWNTVTIPESENAGDCDYISVKLDDQGTPWLAWQSARGSAYEVFCASLDGAGGLRVESLTPGSQTHNLYPEIVFDPEPTVVWYTAREDGFFLVGERFDRSTGRWGEAKLSNLEDLPGEPLPHLFRRPTGPLAALWYEKPTNAESDAVFDRVYLGEQNANSRGTGEALDQPLDGSNTQIAGAALGDRVVAAWCSTSAIEGPQIYAAHGTTARDSALLKLSDGDELYYSSPRVAVGGRDAVVVWQSALSDGGDGRIYAREIKQLY